MNKFIDSSSFGLHQQQGCWYTSDEWADDAFKIKIDAGIASADELIALAPKKEFKFKSNKDGKPVFIESRVKAALNCLDLSEYDIWTKCALSLKAAWGEQSKHLWLVHSKQGKYDPSEFWDSLEPRIAPGAGAGLLFATARDVTIDNVNTAKKSGSWEQKDIDALAYLKLFHHRVFLNLTSSARA